MYDDLIESLRSLARSEHDDHSIGAEAADALQDKDCICPTMKLMLMYGYVQSGKDTFGENSYVVHLYSRLMDEICKATGGAKRSPWKIKFCPFCGGILDGWEKVIPEGEKS